MAGVRTRVCTASHESHVSHTFASAEVLARFVARVDARSRAGTGDTIEFYLDTKELHFFDPETHLAIDDAEVVSRERVLLSRSKDAE